jgi:hypothetical protein
VLHRLGHSLLDSGQEDVFLGQELITGIRLALEGDPGDLFVDGVEGVGNVVETALSLGSKMAVKGSVTVSVVVSLKVSFCSGRASALKGLPICIMQLSTAAVN